MNETQRTVTVPGVLREPFREFLGTAPATPERTAALAAWDALAWRGRGGNRSASSAELSVTYDQAGYLKARLYEFVETDDTMLVRPAARKMIDRLDVGWSVGW